MILSVCIITKNEAANIIACMKDAWKVADEVVVMDTGSTDETVEFAEHYGAKIGHCQWTNDFSAARNASLDLASGHWIFWMDADDRLPDESAAWINRFKMEWPDKAFTFMCVNKAPCGMLPEYEAGSWQIRMFPRRADLRFVHRIHEQILPALQAGGVPVVKASDRVVIDHLGYQNADVLLAKRRRNNLLRLAQEYGWDLSLPIKTFKLFDCECYFNGRQLAVWHETTFVGVGTPPGGEQADIMSAAIQAVVKWRSSQPYLGVQSCLDELERAIGVGGASALPARSLSFTPEEVLYGQAG